MLKHVLYFCRVWSQYYTAAPFIVLYSNCVSTCVYFPGILQRDQENSVIYGSIDAGKTVTTNPEFLKLVSMLKVTVEGHLKHMAQPFVYAKQRWVTSPPPPTHTLLIPPLPLLTITTSTSVSLGKM